MLQVLELAWYIDVPEQDVTDNRVTPGFEYQPAGDIPIQPLIQIQSSSQKPGDYYRR